MKSYNHPSIPFTYVITPFTDVDECASNPCINGACVNDLNFYACNCDPGWSGYNCDAACAENPCENGGSCMEINATSLECQCPFPFNGTFCEISK